jgi:signal transduction histidine kinase
MSSWLVGLKSMRLTVRVLTWRLHRPEVRFERGWSYFWPVRSPWRLRSLNGMNMLDRLAERGGTAANVGLGVVFAAVLAFEGSALARTGGDWLFDCGVGAALCTVALLRGRNPAWAAAIGLAIFGAAQLAARFGYVPGRPTIGAATLALLVLGGAVIRVLPVWQAAVIWAAGVAVVVGEGITIAPGSAGGPRSTDAVVWGAALGTGLWLRLRDWRREAAICRREAAIETVRRDERLELARELHDATAHHITGIVIQAQAARIAARKHAETLDSALAGIESVGTDALTSMRQVIGLLRDTDDAGGLTPGPEQLTDLVDRFAGRGPAVQLRLPDGPADPTWPPEVTTTVYRVVSEALTNITRHAAGAREVTVTLAHDQQAITAEITDDAPPAGSPRFPHASGYGLVGMRERVESLGGTLSAGPAPGAGWSVLATLPAPGKP